MTELETMTEAVFKAVNDYVARSVGPLVARVAELEARVALVKDGKDGEIGKAGENGKDAEVDYTKIYSAISDLLNQKLAAIPPAKDGEPGKDATVDYDAIHAQIQKMIPAPIAGEAGKQGEKGDKGADAVIDYEAIKQEIALLIPAPIPGAKGERGEKGDVGADAVVDYQLLKDEIKALIPAPIAGEKGERGEKGEDGKDGINGENGIPIDGAPGRDALEIEPLSEIDFTRSYARRTYAMHRGGLWICRRSLPGAESWECVQDGIADLAFDETDNIRTLALSVETSSGRKVNLAKRIPMLIFKGVWTAGEFDLGDVVQRDGSMWHAKKTTAAEPGILDANRDWQLLIKRGQDGKDLTQRSPANLEQKVIKIK